MTRASCTLPSTYEDKGTASRPRRDRGKDGNEKDGDEETKSRCHRRQSGTPTFGNSCAAFDECCDRRAPKQRADGDTYSITAIGNG